MDVYMVRYGELSEEKTEESYFGIKLKNKTIFKHKNVYVYPEATYYFRNKAKALAMAKEKEKTICGFITVTKLPKEFAETLINNDFSKPVIYFDSRRPFDNYPFTKDGELLYLNITDEKYKDLITYKNIIHIKSFL